MLNSFIIIEVFINWFQPCIGISKQIIYFVIVLLLLLLLFILGIFHFYNASPLQIPMLWILYVVTLFLLLHFLPRLMLGWNGLLPLCLQLGYKFIPLIFQRSLHINNYWSVNKNPLFKFSLLFQIRLRYFSVHKILLHPQFHHWVILVILRFFHLPLPHFTCLLVISNR